MSNVKEEQESDTKEWQPITKATQGDHAVWIKVKEEPVNVYDSQEWKIKVEVDAQDKDTIEIKEELLDDYVGEIADHISLKSEVMQKICSENLPSLMTIETKPKDIIQTIEKPLESTNFFCISSNKESHINNHIGENVSKPSCCLNDSDGEKKLRDYSRIQKDKLFQCYFCLFVTKHNRILKIHMRTHSGEKLFKCSLCSYSSVYKGHLKTHMRTHTGEKPFKCSLCSLSLTQKESLKTHMRTHTGEKPFKCSLCSYSSAQHGALIMHMRTHTGEKSFKCSFCSYSSTQKQNLKRHILTHTGEKPFKCSLCSFSSARKNSLRTHMGTHTGEKPFKCSCCSFSSGQKEHLKTHMRTHT